MSSKMTEKMKGVSLHCFEYHMRAVFYDFLVVSFHMFLLAGYFSYSPSFSLAIQANALACVAMSHTYLTKIDPAKNQYRYYSVRVDPDLFGAWTLFRQWGRIDAEGGMLRMDSFDSEAEALAQLSKIVKQKQNRGYQ